MTTIQHNNKTLTLTQDPYATTVLNRQIGDTVETINGDVFRATATDQDGANYDVFWTTLADGEVSDWNRYVVLAA